MSDKAFFEGEYPSMEILLSSRKGGVVYAAARKREAPETVFALVFPFSYHKGHHNFFWKEQDETVGPYSVEAPAKVLDMLTETDSEYATEWRAACRARAAEVAVAKAKASVVGKGTVIEMAEPVFYGRKYGSFSRFQYTGKGSTFVAVGESGLPVLRVGLPKWKERDFSVVEGGV